MNTHTHTKISSYGSSPLTASGIMKTAGTGFLPQHELLSFLHIMRYTNVVCISLAA